MIVLACKRLVWFVQAFKIKKNLKNQTFWKIFLLANSSIKIILEMLFLFFINANIEFTEKELIWKIYSIDEALLNIKQVQSNDSKIFVVIVLNFSKNTFIIHVTCI